MKKAGVNVMDIEIMEIFFCSCKNAYHPHEGIKIPTRHHKGVHAGYHFRVLSYCCTEMKHAIDDNFVTLGDNDSCLDSLECKRANIVKPSWECSRKITSINFCPFCGARIIIKRNKQ